MKALLSIEWLKIKNYFTFWILAGLFVLLLPLWNYGIANGVLRPGGNTDINILSQVYSFAYVWDNVGFWASIFVVFLSILVIIITTNEYQFRTNRQNIMDGWSRLQFYHAKCYLVLMLSLLTTVYVFIVGFLFGIANDDLASFPGDSLYRVFYVFVLSLNYYGFSLLLSIFFKRSGITIGMFFFYCWIIESMVKGFVNWRFDTTIGNYMPLQSSDELLPFPILDMIKSLAKLQEAPSGTSYVIASFAWIAVYYFVGRRKLLRSDW